MCIGWIGSTGKVPPVKKRVKNTMKMEVVSKAICVLDRLNGLDRWMTRRVLVLCLRDFQHTPACQKQAPIFVDHYLSFSARNLSRGEAQSKHLKKGVLSTKVNIFRGKC